MKITIPENEYFDDDLQEFITEPEMTVELEHSLYTMAQWESKYKRAFMSERDSNSKMSDEEMLEYIKIMSLGALDDEGLKRLTRDKNAGKQISEYIQDPHTATTITDRRQGVSHGSPTKEVVTSELIYFNMIHFGIPFECQHWHLNRLLTLIRVCGIKEAEINGGKKSGAISTRDILKNNGDLNKARRAAMNTKG